MREHLSDDLDGELTLLRRIGLKLHLLACPACRVVCSALRDTVATLRGLRPPDRETHL